MTSTALVRARCGAESALAVAQRPGTHVAAARRSAASVCRHRGALAEGIEVAASLAGAVSCCRIAASSLPLIAVAEWRDRGCVDRHFSERIDVGAHHVEVVGIPLAELRECLVSFAGRVPIDGERQSTG